MNLSEYQYDYFKIKDGENREMLQRRNFSRIISNYSDDCIESEDEERFISEKFTVISFHDNDVTEHYYVLDNTLNYSEEDFLKAIAYAFNENEYGTCEYIVNDNSIEYVDS